MNNKKNVTIFIRILLVISLMSGIFLFLYGYSVMQAENNFDRLAQTYEENQELDNKNTDEEKEPETNIALEELYEENNDTVAWIYIPGTDVNYPVMQTPEQPEYYLYRNFDKEYSLSGVPFIDVKASIEPRSDNILIHGHNMKNGSMFAQLLKYRDKDFLDNYSTIELHTFSGKELYDIIAVIPTDINKKTLKFDYHNFFNAEDEKEFDKYVSDAKKYSLHDTGLPAEYGDDLITLSTCAYHIDNGRFVVIGKKR